MNYDLGFFDHETGRRVAGSIVNRFARDDDRTRPSDKGGNMPTRFAIAAFATFFIAGLAYGGGSPPTDAGFSFDIPAGAGCDFPVNWTVTGKSSVITLPGDRLIVASPQQKVVVTNLDAPSNTVTFFVTSALHVSTDDNGDVFVVATGRSLLGDPVANTMLFVIGTFSWRFDPVNSALLDLSGKGQMADVCAMIE
jgi:hypothetical protein